MTPKVTVIIPTYNRRQVLGRAIESVLAQTCSDWELIVVDDGSTDGTAEDLLAVQNHDQVRVIRQANQGVSAARNAGIRCSTAQWVAFLDSDDEWLPEKLQLQLEHANTQPHLPLIHGDEIWIRNGVRVNPMNKHQKSGGRLFQKSLGLCCISPSTVMLKRSLLEEVGLFREDYPVCEDYDLWLKITALYEVGYVDQFLIKKYGGHDDQLSRKFKAMDYWRVKSISDCLKSLELSPEDRQAAGQVLIKKRKVLLKGYRRHENLEHYDEVFQIIN